MSRVWFADYDVSLVFPREKAERWLEKYRDIYGGRKFSNGVYVSLRDVDTSELFIEIRHF
mgnify:CR=1 FL=1